MNKCVDFDRFIAEREKEKIEVKLFGRRCLLPSELPWHYVMKIQRMVQLGEPISGEENRKMLAELLSPPDFAYVTGHSRFRASYFWEIIAQCYLRDNEPDDGEFVCEDEVKVRQTASKKAGSARSSSGRTSRLTF